MTEKGSDDRAVTAEEVSWVGNEVLRRCADLSGRPFALMAGLRSAASSIENSLTANLMKTSVAAAVANILSGRKN